MKKSYFGNKVSSILTGWAFSAALLIPLVGHASANKFIDSGDYKDKEFKTCNINDYSQMIEDGDVNWVWLSNDIKLADHGVAIAKIENKSAKAKKSDSETVQTSLQYAIEDAKLEKKANTLNADICIYDVQNYSFGKRFIPFSGGYLAQAGVGVEVTLRDGDKTVAMMRHFTREGSSIKEAADEVAEDVFDYIAKH